MGQTANSFTRSPQRNQLAELMESRNLDWENNRQKDVAGFYCRPSENENSLLTRRKLFKILKNNGAMVTIVL